MFAARDLLTRLDVVSLEHAFLVDLFRRRPELARELLRHCQHLEIPGVRAELGSVDLTQVAPSEFRADAVIVTRDEAEKAVAAVVVEIQLGLDERKRFTWPVYVTTLRATLECPVTLLVIAPEPAVARWCQTPIWIGGGMSLVPQVVRFADVPRITEPVESQAQPEMSILSALAHEELAIVRVALDQLRHLPEDDQDVYLDLLLSLLPENDRRLHMDLKNYEFKSWRALEVMAENREKGREEGREKGREEGREEGRMEATSELLRRLVVQKFGVSEAEARARLAAVDPGRYPHLIDRILVAPTLEALLSTE